MRIVSYIGEFTSWPISQIGQQYQVDTPMSCRLKKVLSLLYIHSHTCYGKLACNVIHTLEQVYYTHMYTTFKENDCIILW